MNPIVRQTLDFLREHGPLTAAELVEKMKESEKGITLRKINARMCSLRIKGHIRDVGYKSKRGKLTVVWGMKPTIEPRRIPIPLMLDLGERYAD